MAPRPTIIVHGNIATGKSTLCESLCRCNPDLLLVSMDRVRAQQHLFGAHANAMARDRASEWILLELADTPSALLYETSAATDLYRRMRRVIVGRRRGPVAMIRTTCSKRTALERAEQRRTSGHMQFRPAARSRMSLSDMWDHFEEHMPTEAGLVLDTERYNAEACSTLAITWLTSRGMWTPGSPRT